MPLIFNQFINSPPSTTATYYAHVLTSIPTGAEATVSALSLATASGYVPMNITVTTSVSGAITNWSFADVLWSALNWNTSLYGTAIVLQVGGSKDPAVDKPFLFYEFENGLRAPIVLTPGYFGLRFSTGISYAFSTQASNKYDVGTFVGFPLYKDMLTLLNSNNGTRYTPGSVYVPNQFFTGTFAQAYNLSPLCYWLGDRVMRLELQGRHDIQYNNITFPTLPSPVLGLNAAATFNGVDSYVNLGHTTINGGDFTAGSGVNGTQQTLLFYFYPTLNNTEEILLDTTTSNNSGGYVIRKTATNRIEFLYITAGTPHTVITFTATNNVLTIDAWNLVIYGSYGGDRSIWVNNIETGVSIASSYTSPTVANGIRIGARRGLNSSFTGANFTGKMLYYMSGFDKRPNGMSTYPIITNRNSQLPYNPDYTSGWGQTGLNINTEMTTPNTFPADRSTFLRSIGNLSTYVGAQNLVANGGVLSQVRIDQPDCFYINFGQNKTRPGTIALIFPTTNLLAGVKLDTAASSAVFSIWGANTLPGNSPTNVNLVNRALWEKFDFTINGISNAGSFTDLSGLSLTTSGGYRYYLLDTNITKYFKYLRMGWKNAVTNGTGGGGSVNGFAHYLLYNSSVLSSSIDLVPPIAGYSA